MTSKSSQAAAVSPPFEDWLKEAQRKMHAVAAAACGIGMGTSEPEVLSAAEAALLAHLALRPLPATVRLSDEIASERTAQLIAHRACCGSENDPAQGKLHGYCVVCGIPWPCEYAGKPPRAGDAAPAAPADEPVMPSALRDVIAERERQKVVEGWTPDHDDQHAPGQLATAGYHYAANAAANLGWQPGSLYTWDNWPWHPSWWRPTTPRRDLVKAGALILAEIERFDRKRDFSAARLPARDECGHVNHPDMDGIGWDEFDMGPQLRALGWHSTTTSFEDDATAEQCEQYSNSNSPDCSYWTPTPPKGEGWLMAAIYDTEDGPVALFVRKADDPASAAAGVRGTPEASDETSNKPVTGD